MREEDPREPSMYRQFGIFFVVTSAFLGSSGAGVGIGWLLWKKAAFPWWIILITTGLGLYAASLQVIRYQKKLQK
jgi:F0F1-type ATP synthase assembly protein I